MLIDEKSLFDDVLFHTVDSFCYEILFRIDLLSDLKITRNETNS